MKSYKNIKYYVNLPWTYTVEMETHEGSSYYIIRVNELPGICTDSESLDEGMREIKKLIVCAIEIYKEKKKLFLSQLTEINIKEKFFIHRTRENLAL